MEHKYVPQMTLLDAGVMESALITHIANVFLDGKAKNVTC